MARLAAVQGRKASHGSAPTFIQTSLSTVHFEFDTSCCRLSSLLSPIAILQPKPTVSYVTRLYPSPATRKLAVRLAYHRQPANTRPHPSPHCTLRLDLSALTKLLAIRPIYIEPSSSSSSVLRRTQSSHNDWRSVVTVSYTHLTLPTIYSV